MLVLPLLYNSFPRKPPLGDPVPAYKRESLALGQWGSRREREGWIEEGALARNQTPLDGDEPTRTNMRRSADEDPETGAPPSQDLARTPPCRF
jgi:hypothetical protein